MTPDPKMPDYVGKRLLIVDDASTIRHLLTRILDHHGFVNETAADGREALKKLAKTPFDLVITDIAMPVMDGLALTQEVVGQGGPDVIVMTGKIDQYSYDRVVALGASDYIEKPFSAEEILLRVKRVLRERSLQQDAARLQQEKEQVRRFEAIGQLAAGIAHEINTPIQYIGDNVQFLGDSFDQVLALLGQLQNLAGSGEELKKALAEADLDFICEEIPIAVDQALEGVRRIKQIVSAMKSFSHPGKEEHTMADVNRCIETTAVISKNEWKYVADLDLDLDRQLPEIRCNPGELNQVFLNLIINACHAIEEKMVAVKGEKGLIQIQTRFREPWVEIEVTDSGTGIDDKVLGRIFDPFFTTKGIGKGTGQGLAIVRSIVTQHHQGKIEVDTWPGKGTRFLIRLPLKSVS